MRCAGDRSCSAAYCAESSRDARWPWWLPCSQKGMKIERYEAESSPLTTCTAGRSASPDGPERPPEPRRRVGERLRLVLRASARARLRLLARARLAHQVLLDGLRGRDARDDHARARVGHAVHRGRERRVRHARSGACAAGPRAGACAAWPRAWRSRPQHGGQVQPDRLLHRAGRLWHHVLEVLVRLQAQRAQQREALAPRPTRRRVHRRVEPARARPPAHCMHTRTAPSDSLRAASSVVSHPRDPALVTRVRMERSDCDVLEQQRGEAVRSRSVPRCSQVAQRWPRCTARARAPSCRAPAPPSGCGRPAGLGWSPRTRRAPRSTRPRSRSRSTRSNASAASMPRAGATSSGHEPTARAHRDRLEHLRRSSMRTIGGGLRRPCARRAARQARRPPPPRPVR